MRLEPVRLLEDGFWVIEVSSEAEAHALAAEASQACNRRIELRPVLG